MQSHVRDPLDAQHVALLPPPHHPAADLHHVDAFHPLQGPEAGESRGPPGPAAAKERLEGVVQADQHAPLRAQRQGPEPLGIRLPQAGESVELIEARDRPPALLPSQLALFQRRIVEPVQHPPNRIQAPVPFRTQLGSRHNRDDHMHFLKCN